MPPGFMSMNFMNGKTNTNGNNNDTKKTKKKGTDSSYTASKFTDNEKDTLTDIIGEILPVGNPCWNKVESSYNAMFPNRKRHLENLRTQFNTLAKTMMPTEPEILTAPLMSVPRRGSKRRSTPSLQP